MKRLLLALVLILTVMTVLFTGTALAGEERCFPHELEDTPHGRVVDGRVVLNPFNPDWFGDHFSRLIIGDQVWLLPVSGVPYGEDVTAWEICKGTTTTTTSSTSTSTSTTSTTTTRPTTTTETTVPSSTTTTTAPTTTTTPSSTTQPPTSVTTSTSVPPTTLPWTGVDGQLVAGYAIALLTLGGLIVLTVKHR